MISRDFPLKHLALNYPKLVKSEILNIEEIKLFENRQLSFLNLYIDFKRQEIVELVSFARNLYPKNTINGLTQLSLIDVGRLQYLISDKELAKCLNFNGLSLRKYSKLSIDSIRSLTQYDLSTLPLFLESLIEIEEIDLFKKIFINNLENLNSEQHNNMFVFVKNSNYLDKEDLLIFIKDKVLQYEAKISKDLQRLNLVLKSIEVKYQNLKDLHEQTMLSNDLNLDFNSLKLSIIVLSIGILTSVLSSFMQSHFSFNER